MEIKEMNLLNSNKVSTDSISPDIGLDTMAINEVTKHLKHVLANSYALMLKTQNYHWNVTGELFKPIHELTEINYLDLFQAVDIIAERIRALGETAPGSFSEYSALSNLTEIRYGLTALEMATDLYHGNETLARECRKALEIAGQYSDEASADLLTERLRTHEKNAWMWRSFIKK